VVGLGHLLPEPPALILSGVNRGANLGMETVFSGTVGGAMTGMMLGVPSIALSQAWTDPANVRWDTTRRLAPGVIRDLLTLGWGADTCLNVNFPDRPAEQVGALTLARQGVGMIRSIEVETRTDPRGFPYHWLAFRRGPRAQGPESDLTALREGRIAVTPIRYDRTDEAAYAALAERLPRLG
jgi:5'-nucleotidase